MTPQEVSAALAQLGDTADEIAARLLRMGVRGHPLRLDVCPIARFLCERFPGHTFEVDGHRVQVDGLGRIETSLPVMDFVHGFDRGRWPGLFERIA